jgi:hypothetical protein
MTPARLKEIKKKFDAGDGELKELNEVLSDLFLSSSEHLKEIKTKLSEIQKNQEALGLEMQALKSSMNPIYTIIQTED